MLIKAFVKVNDLAGNFAVLISSALLVYIVGHITVEIAMRHFFESSTFSMDEFVGYAIGAMTFLSLAHTFRYRKHIRVSILQSFVKGRVALAVELLCIAFTLTETPIWMVDTVIFVGLVLFLSQLLASAVLAIRDGVPEDEAVE